MEAEDKVKKWHFKGDKVILILMVLLSLVSVLLVYSTEGNRVTSHLFHLVACYLGVSVGYIVNYKKMVGNFAFLGMILSVVLLVLTIGSSAVRGITLFGFDIQTFYLIGFFVIIFLSNYIGRRLDGGKERLERGEERYALGVLLLFCGGIAMLNMSTAIILFVTGIVIFFIGNFRWGTLFKVAGIVAVVVAVMAALVYSGKMDNVGRLNTFVNRWEYYFTKDNSEGYGDQMILSRAAIARSGLNPAGPGKGVIKYRLPENSTDYAYASLFEETGIVVGLIIIIVYFMIFYRSWNIARNSKSSMGSILAFGIGFWLTCQAFVHIGVNCELLPATGQTLPFVSTGGASLFVSGIAMGILLNISKVNEEDRMKTDPRTLYIQGKGNLN